MLIRIPIIPTSGQVHSSFIEQPVSVFTLKQVQYPQTVEQDTQYGVPTERVSSSPRFFNKEKTDALNMNCIDNTRRRRQIITFCFLPSIILSHKLQFLVRDFFRCSIFKKLYPCEFFSIFSNSNLKYFLVTYHFKYFFAAYI